MRPHSLSVPGRRFAASAAVVLASVVAAPQAFAQSAGSCPPGAWFCADVDPPAGSAQPGKGPAQADDKKGASASDEKGSEVAVPPSQGGTTIIVNTAPPPHPPPPPARRAPPPAPRAVVVSPPPRYEPPPPPRRRVIRSEWGFNMHLLGALMETKKQQAASESGMGGLGFSLRARPTGHFALDLGLDFIGGKDFQGYQRSEVPFTVNAMIFVNPRSKVQLYFLGGLGWSTARVQVPGEDIAKYSYFGVQSGVGLEFRVAKHVALNLDILGFIRGRTDDKAATQPEFIDPDTGKRTNTSGGGLARGGMTIYW
jgi:opacity protein-like surface antigen